MFRFPLFAFFDNISPFYWLRSVKLFAFNLFFVLPFPLPTSDKITLSADGNVTCALSAHCFFGIVFSRTCGLVWLGFLSSGLVSFLVSLGFLVW